MKKEKIPKTIHYCWFGKKQLSDLANKCIESWEKFLPNYEIKQWNETNFDVHCCKYVEQAYENRKYAFVSDYARFKILYEHGGIYFDTDVELIKSIDDIIEKGPFMGFEKNNTGEKINPGCGLATYPKHKIFNEILDVYKNLSFVKVDGTLNTKTVVEYTTEVLKKYGLQFGTNIQKIENIYLYPKEYFSPKEFETQEIVITENTRSIHHYNASWVDSYSRREYLKIGKYKIVRFKRNQQIIEDKINLKGNEQICFLIRVSKNKKFAILKDKNR